MTREEAIKIIESNCSCSDSKLREACAMFVPELKESEDEIIRKSIIHILQVGGYMPDEEKKKAFAYLERQKERGPLSKNEEYTLARIIEYLEDNDCPSEWKDLLHDVYSLPYQKEQKPAEWSEEDKKFIKELCNLLASIAKNNYVGGYYAPDLVSKLQSLRPQSHKWYIKKGHWYICIVDKPEYGWTKGEVYQSPEDNRLETNYKGSLTNWPDSEPWFRPATRSEIPDNQPHWKPSEEQMEALFTCTSVGSFGHRAALKSLYNDLKKL